MRRNISGGQIAGYAIANMAGLVIVLTALQFYRDISSVSDAEDSFVSADYMIISKRVEGLDGLMGGGQAATTFTADERLYSLSLSLTSFSTYLPEDGTTAPARMIQCR